MCALCWRLLQLHHIFCNIHCKYVCIYPDSPSTTKASKRNDAAACLFIQPPHQNTTASIKWPSLYILFYSSLLGKAVMMNMHNNNIQMNPMWRFLICTLEWCNLAQSVFQSIVVEILSYQWTSLVLPFHSFFLSVESGWQSFNDIIHASVVTLTIPSVQCHRYYTDCSCQCQNLAYVLNKNILRTL